MIFSRKANENLEKIKKIYDGSSMNEKKRVILYTDGACSGNPGVGGYGGILSYGERELEYNGAEGDTTNNRMEVMAVIVGLKRLKYPCIVEVYSDSAYTVNAFNEKWIYGWKKKGWKKADGKEVLNVDLWEELYELTKVHEVSFHKVAGHADNEKNNRCDALARGAIVEYNKLKDMEG